MIGYFPTPFQDEMIYSIISRYHVISSNLSENCTTKELFSRNMLNIKMDLFPYAETLEERLKHFNFYSAQEIINYFTFYNYYKNFLDVSSRGKYKSSLEKYNSKYYKFCLNCFKEEINSGIPYWHISHNLPGSTICLKHNCKLTMSDVLFNGKKLIPLSKEVQGVPIPTLSETEEEILKKINEETIFIFSTKQNLSEYLTPYFSFLYNMGYIKDIIFDEKRVKEDFTNFYSDNICEILGINKEYVIPLIIDNIKFSTRNIHPLCHILFVIFCGKKMEDIINTPMTSFNSIKLNCSLCELLVKESIHTFVLRYRRQGIIGTFRCNCGYSFYIESWEKEKIVTNYSEDFFEYINELLFDEDLSISEICKQLHIRKQDLKRYIIDRKL